MSVIRFPALLVAVLCLVACTATRATSILHSIGTREPRVGTLPVLSPIRAGKRVPWWSASTWGARLARLVAPGQDGVDRVVESAYVYVDPALLRAHAHAAFSEWSRAANKTYASGEEYSSRLATWLDNLEYVIGHNGQGKGYRVGMNAFADMRHEEWRAMMGFSGGKRFVRSTSGQAGFMYDDVDVGKLPRHVDWTAKGVVGPVKAQGMCGSCWAFSTTGAIEGIDAIVTGELKSLSEQMLIDCDTTRDSGCDGGLMDFAFDFVHENGGIDTEESYPYLERDGQCDLTRLNRHVVTIDGYEDVPEDDEEALKKAVAHQPVSVAIEADHRSFQLYAGGVFDDLGCGTELNHGVLVVGYGTDDPVNMTAGSRPYWKVKNSWGAWWGENGFVKLARTVSGGLGAGECGIAKMASYPIKYGADPPEPPPAPPMPPPPPPEPQPVDCDPTTACPPDTTCCCMQDYFGFCFQWACCPMPEATCCEDKIHCCPKDMPVCNVASGTCGKGSGTYGADGDTVPMQRKLGPIKKAGLRVALPH